MTVVGRFVFFAATATSGVRQLVAGGF